MFLLYVFTCLLWFSMCEWLFVCLFFFLAFLLFLHDPAVCIIFSREFLKYCFFPTLSPLLRIHLSNGPSLSGVWSRSLKTICDGNGEIQIDTDLTSQASVP